MISINDYLDKILEDFKEYAQSGEKLCKLKDVRFDAGRLPDYSDKNVQQLYLLRYAYAYTFEYKRMYQDLMALLKNKSQLSVTSIGCGSMIDYWSLTRVFPKSCDICYIGVDVIDWNYKLNGRGKDKVTYINADFVDLISRHAIIPTDVYIFPKSISEFSATAIFRICVELSSLIPDRKPVYFLFSLRSKSASQQIDISKTKLLHKTMLNLGFTSNDDPESFSNFEGEEKDKKIYKVDSSFSHPTDVVEFLVNTLPACCTHYDESSCDNSCKQKLRWWPILSCSQVNYQIFKFVKEA